MGSVIDAGKAGARSVSESPSPTLHERPEAAREAIRNDSEHGLDLLLDGGNVTAVLAAMPDAKVRAVLGYFDSQRTCALMNLATFAKLLSVCDSAEVADDVPAIGWLLHQLTTAAEFNNDVAVRADSVLALREHERAAQLLDTVNAGLAAGDDALQAHRAAAAAIKRFGRSGDKAELRSALASVEAAEKASDKGYTAVARLGYLTGCAK